jgi:hypothetical protein
MRTTMRLLLLALAALLAVMLLPSTVRAADPGPDTLPITVIAIQTSDADDQAEALTKALRVAVKNAAGWSLGTGDYSLEVLTLSLKCGDKPDANCQSRIADQIKADRYVWGVLKKKGATVTGEVHLWVRGKGTSNWPLDYSANVTDSNDDGLRRIAGDAISHLTGGAPKGGLHVRAGDVNGQVFLDGQPLGAIKGEASFMVPSGSHKVTVKAVGYADMDGQVMVKPVGAPAEVSLTMVAVSESSPMNGRRIGGIAAIAVGGVAAVVGFASMAQVASAQSKINQQRQSISKPPSFDWCNPPAAGLADSCSKGKTFQTLQIVMFPVAAVAAGVGIFLVATSGKSAPKTTGLTVNPQVGPGGGMLDVGYTW